MNDVGRTERVPKPLLDIEDIATWTKRSVASLYQLRHRGKGPRAIKVGRVLRFRRSDVEAWLTSLEDAS